MAQAKGVIKYFKYVNTVRTKKGKLRTWKGHDRVTKVEAKKDQQGFWRNK